MRRNADALVATVAAGQHGMVTTAQLHGAGLSADQIAHRVDVGLLHRRHRGVYRVGPIEMPFGPPAAALLAVGEDAVLSHRTAAIVLRLTDLLPTPLMTVHVTVPDRRPRKRDGIELHVVRRPVPVVVRNDLRVTSPLRTLFDEALEEDPETLEQLLARVLRQRLVRPAELTHELSTTSHPGAEPVRLIVERGAKFTRSEAEGKLLDLIRRAALPEPDATNVRLRGFEADAVWTGPRIVVEVDSFGFHNDPASFRRDRDGESDLEAAGWHVIRTTWFELTMRPERFVARLARAFAARERLAA